METQFNEVVVYESVKSGEMEIDAEGRIWRLKRRRSYGRIGPCERTRAEVSNGRYLQVKVTTSDGRKYAAAHRLVWHHFNGPIPPGKTVNHKDGVTDNNRPLNLELATSKEQTEHAYAVLKRKRAGPAGESNIKTHLVDSDVRAIRARAGRGEPLDAIARAYNISRDAAYRIVSRRSWKHIP